MRKLLATVLSLFIALPAFALAPIKAPSLSAGTSGATGAAGAGIRTQGAAARGVGSQLILNFNLTPEQILKTYEGAAAQLDKDLDAVAAVSEAEATFQNTVLAVETAWSDYQDKMAGVRQLSVSPEAEVREAVDKVNKLAGKLDAKHSLREDIYQSVLNYAKKGEKLKGEDKKLLEETLREFNEGGMALSPAERERLKALGARISNLVRQYSVNLREWEGGIEVRPEELDGVPASFVGSLKKLKNGKLYLPDDGAVAGQVMAKGKSAKTRMRLYYAMQRKGAKKNLPILQDVLKLRKEQAQMLGFRNFAQMRTKGRMAETPKNALSFLNRLKRMLKSAAAKDEAEILTEKRKEKPGATKVHPWDESYYGRKHMEATLDLNPDTVKEYFPYKNVLPEALKVYEELLGIRFVPVTDAKMYHKDVKVYDVLDADGTRMGRLHLDLFERKGKRSGAWAAPLVGGRRLDDGTYQEPVVAVSADFAEAEKGKPRLLRHASVKTLFHELGHAMHMLLTVAERPSFAGSSVAWDFVEMPSQMMENFIWNPQVLARVSKHYKTGKPIPSDLVKKLLASRNYHSASGTLGQAAMSAMDLIYYIFAPEDVLGVFRRVMKTFTGQDVNPASKFPARFNHILSGYAAGYYGYLWSRVSAQDVFSIFEADGVMSPSVGNRYRGVFLERGSTVEEKRSMKDFLGRDPDEKAFLNWLGVK